MKEWIVIFVRRDSPDECMIVLPSFRKLLLWFICTAWRCSDIHIFID